MLGIDNKPEPKQQERKVNETVIQRIFGFTVLLPIVGVNFTIILSNILITFMIVNYN